MTDLRAEVLGEVSRRLKKSVASRDTGLSRERAGVELLTGHGEAASALLLDLLDEHPKDPSLWNDLAVGYLDRARQAREADARLLAKALDAAAESVALAPREPEPRFNLALGLEALGLTDAAIEAWTQAITLERDADWRAEARARLDHLRAQSADGWQADRQRLLDERERIDPAAVEGSVQNRTQPVREFIENELLPRWGQAVLEVQEGDVQEGDVQTPGRASRAETWLSRAKGLGQTLARAQDDPLLTETFAAIDHATGSSRAIGRLARAHHAYGRGMQLYEGSAREAALAAFAQAEREFEAAGSPFRLRAELQIGVVIYQLSRFAEAERVFARVGAAAARDGYVVTLGLARWLEGISAMQRGRIETSLDAYREASAAFKRATERQNQATVASAAADTLRRVGEHADGWNMLTDALINLREVRSARRRYTILLNASLFAADDGLSRSALYFQNASLAAARERGTANTLIEGLTRRARLAVQAGDLAAATRDLNDAATNLPAVPSASARAYVAGWLERVRAESLVETDPVRAAALFEGARGFFAKTEPNEVPALLLGAGHAWRRAGRDDAALRSFDEGLQLFERRLALLSGDQYRVSYIDDGWELYRALIEMHAIQRADPARAWRLAERGRMAALRKETSGTGLADPAAIQRRLDPAATMLYYSVLDEHLLIWHMTASGVRFLRQDVTRQVLQRHVTAYRRLIETGRPRNELERAGKALHAILVPSSVRDDSRRGPLIVISDSFLHAVPFAALIDPSTGRYLIEDRPVLVASSAAHALERPAAMTDARRWTGPAVPLVVGGSTSSPLARRLGRLPDVAAELRDVAALYRRATLLEEDRATVESLRAVLPRHNVLHFAGHAVANERFPWRSQLVLAPDPRHPEDTVSFEELRDLDLSSLRLVVLSACRTAAGPVREGEGVISLMRPFLAARVPALVGTLWDVQDAPAREFLTRFHEAYARQQNHFLALQQAQIAFVRSGNTAWQHPRAWAAFIASGRLLPSSHGVSIDTKRTTPGPS